MPLTRSHIRVISSGIRNCKPRWYSNDCMPLPTEMWGRVLIKVKSHQPRLWRLGRRFRAVAFSLFKESILLAPALRAVPGLVEEGSPRQDNTRCHEIFYILGGALIPAREPGRFCGRAIWLVRRYNFQHAFGVVHVCTRSPTVLRVVVQYSSAFATRYGNIYNLSIRKYT